MFNKTREGAKKLAAVQNTKQLVQKKQANHRGDKSVSGYFAVEVKLLQVAPRGQYLYDLMHKTPVE